MKQSRRTTLHFRSNTKRDVVEYLRLNRVRDLIIAGVIDYFDLNLERIPVEEVPVRDYQKGRRAIGKRRTKWRMIR